MNEEIKTITPPNCINCGTTLVKHREKDYYVCPAWKPNNLGCKGDIWYPDGTRQKNYPNIAISYKVESRTNPGHFYQVKIYESGDITCECMAGEMQKFCYHKQKAIAGIEDLLKNIKKDNKPKAVTSKKFLDREFHINVPYYGAWTKYGWAKDDWGIGLNKERIDRLAMNRIAALVSYGESKQQYTISAQEVQKYPVENVDGSEVKLYIIPRSILNYKKSQEEKDKELALSTM